ncbi:uncharacterized protein GGS22DRAFT_192195 [Annulohypoxylon maeteangense]|uniref:uncharacterized protein n=1 Tax=Annulohypoxylon maeteangense TaxID=1927788 RepID=UPI0020087492|nr:uncharacterized protein GGS22DRAFT_192195 [Annulohypoxylon maeteangense]KAI0881560.1 hypothetical protein GGS22DRAFT_192195 [Annulohypoxylon maeteangense]
MSKRTHTLSSSTKDKKLDAPRPSASIVLLSPENQVLLLHRVQTSSAFPSAHVFPGGNLSNFHDGTIPGPDDVKRHEDSLPYRLGAIRETFEESGILIAREGDANGNPLNLPNAERDIARKSIYKNEVRFVEWLRGVGGVADTDNLLPFTRWITPTNQPRRYTTQMYLYMLPLSISDDPAVSAAQSEAMIPTADGGAEITAARFDYASTWLEKQRKGEIVLFPPQYFLLHLLSQFLNKPTLGSLSSSELTDYYHSQREKLGSFLATVPTASEPKAVKHHTAQIPWADKVISPNMLGVRKSDKRAILGLDKPGPELTGTDRGGDWERVVLVKFAKHVARDVEVRNREEVLAEERQPGNGAKEAKL